MTTADNEHFLRCWCEVKFSKLGIGLESEKSAEGSLCKWFPYNKGGDNRRWYGNNELVVNWENCGLEIKNIKDPSSGRIRSHNYNGEYAFNEAGTWTAICSGDIMVRYSPAGALFDSKGASGFCCNHATLMYCIGLLNTKVSGVFLKVLSPSFEYKVGHVANVPLIVDKKCDVVEISQKAVSLSKSDWDSFETSWNFKYHPFLQWLGSKAMWGASNEKLQQNLVVAESYAAWKALTEQRFLQLKSNEEVLNRIFIDIYGLQDELTPGVEDKDVTIARIYDTKEEIPESMKGNNYVLTKCDVIKSFLSYAVGCMFGRYSLDKPGLIFAGGNFDKVYWKYKGQAACDENGDLPFGSGYAGISMAKYHYPKFRDSENWETATDLTFEPDVDNIIPITDEEYFKDDIVGRFVEFVKVVYGAETLEENLDFIANALGNKGNTSREVIRNYFLNDFFKDHCKTCPVLDFQNH